MRTTYQVHEIFDSIQGEGVWSGFPCTFIRLQGCTVGCPWCDSGPIADARLGRRTNGMTRNTWGKGGTRMTIDEILEQVSYEMVIVTGGEPTLYNLDPLLIPLYERGHRVHLESSGQNALKGIYSFNWVVWSPKENLKWDAPVEFKRLVNEVKWVVDESLPKQVVLETEAWFSDFFAGLEQSPKIPEFTLMPEGCPPKPEMMSRAYTWAMHNPRWRVTDRLQYRIGVR